MTALVINGDTSGSVTLAAPAAAGSTVVTVSPQSGTLCVGGPTFWAYQSSAQSVSASTLTKITFDSTSGFWNSGSYSTSTSRFTPTVSGYYQIIASVGFAATGITEADLYIYKNGSMLTDWRLYQSGTNPIFSGTFLISANGTTDYFEIYVGYAGSGPNNSVAQSDRTYFGGFLARAA